MTSEINPYRPVVHSPEFEGAQDTLYFDGIIEEADYVAFFPLRRSSLSLLRILVVIVSLITAGITGLIVWALATKGFDPAALAVIPVILLMIFLVVLLFWSLRPRLRARRQLRSHPDLLGQARGTVDANGLTFFDGQRTHWFGPSALASTRVESDGIRVPVDLNPYRYLALTARLFDGYSETTAASLAAKWASSEEEPLELQEFHESALQSPLGPNWPLPHQRESCVPFAGEITAELPTRTPEFRKRAIAESAAVLISLVTAIILFGFGMRVIAFASLTPAIFGLVTSVRLWRSYLGNVQTQVWRQLGWIGANEFVWRNENSGLRCSLDQLENVSFSDEMASLTFTNGVTYIIPRQQVPEEKNWDTFTRLLDDLKRPAAASPAIHAD